MLNTFEMLLILYIGFILGAALDHTLPIRDLLVEWQTLTAGLLALLGALLTVKAIYQQTVSAKNTSKAIRQKKAWSYKAQMNGAIHALLGYQYEVFLYINGQQEKLPIRPEKSTDIFQLSLKYIDFNSAQKVYDMLCFLQIQRARLESYAPNSQTDEYQYNYAFTDIIFLYHMLLDMLEYARDEANEIPNNIATPEKMEKATRSLLTNKAGKCFMADLGKHLVIAHQKFDKNNHFLKRNRATFFE